MLAIEDDYDVRELLRTVLTRGGYRVTEAASGREGLRLFHETRPELVILDVGLPDLDGWQVLERIRDMSEAPVVVLTAHAAEQDKIRGLGAGADDYVTKPFSRAELLARLQAISRRRNTLVPETAVLEDGPLRVDTGTREVRIGDTPVELTPTEFRLLATLLKHAGQVMSIDDLLQVVWGDPLGLAPDRVKYTVLRVRRKLGWSDLASSPLESVRGFGYRYRSTG